MESAAAGVAVADAYPGAFYSPGPTISRFIASRHYRDLLRAPNQVGKTLAGAKRADAWSLMHPGSVFGVLVADLENHYPELSVKVAEVITWPEIDPATIYVDGRGFYLHGRRGIRYKNGVRWLFRSGGGPVQGLEGFTAGAAWVDEVARPANYYAFVRGVHGPIWQTLTPIGRDPAWVRARVEGDPATGEPPEEDWHQYVPELSVTECPWRSEAEIRAMVAKYDPIERPQRVRGEWEGPARDRRFTAMHADCIVHDDPTDYLWAGIGMDHGENAGREYAALIVWDDQTVTVIDEYVNPTATDPEADGVSVAAMLERRSVPFARIKLWRGDANSAGKGSVGESVNQQLGPVLGRCFGVPQVMVTVPAKAKGSVAFGERCINIALERRELRVHARCKRLIRALWHYQAAGPRDPEKDPIDGLRYVLLEALTQPTRPSRSIYLGARPLPSLRFSAGPPGLHGY